jgi:hypothetical protein
MDTLYHDCSNSTFLSIVENKSIWLSSLSQSNDSKEGKIVNEDISKMAKDGGLSGSHIQQLRNGISFLEKSFDSLGFCMSEKR